MDEALVVAGPGVSALPASQLHRACDPSFFAFASSAELEPIDGLVGQARAL